MIENIKELWIYHMNSKTKDLVWNSCKKEFKLTSKIAFKQNWIYSGRIPEAHQEKLLNIFQNAVKQQISKLQKSLS